MKSDICVCSIIFNEIELLPAYYRHIKQFAESWVVIDNNSNDGSYEFLKRMREKGEIEITVYKEPKKFCGGSYYGLLNRCFSLADKKWIWAGFPDEFLDDRAISDIAFVVKNDIDIALYYNRVQITSLYPLLQRGTTQKLRLWQAKHNIEWYSNKEGTLHGEDYKIDNDIIEKKIANGAVLDIGEARNIDKIREKELTYEQEGTTILTSKFDNLSRFNFKMKSIPYWDTFIYECLI